ncbi:MAG TPA: copper chaperone PCu(A)C [Burkholderiales bacterium]|nr:copper chaperone PCu(A)C [Burkholderiales bacterium]
MSCIRNIVLKIFQSAVWSMCWVGTTAAGEVDVVQAWVRTTAPGQQVAGAYLQITSAVPAKLIAASSPVAGSVEIHSMRMEGGIMKMRQLQDLDLPANKPVKLEPGGLHLMLLDLKTPLKPGDRVLLRLTVQRANQSRLETEVRAEVRAGPP